MARQKLRRFALLSVLVSACSGGTQTSQSQGSQPKSDSPASDPADDPADDPAGPANADPAADESPTGARMVEPYRVAAEVEQVQAMLFATREAFEAATFATAMMGQTYVEPDFANEHIVGLVAPVAPIGTKLTVKAASFADGVITLATELSKAEAGEGDLEIRPSYVVAIPKHEGARSIVVTVNGETIAELPLQ